MVMMESVACASNVAGGPVKSREEECWERRSCAPFIALFAMSGWDGLGLGGRPTPWGVENRKHAYGFEE